MNSSGRSNQGAQRRTAATLGSRTVRGNLLATVVASRGGR
jgi:hypothetical protein